ncbi:predicted protein [Chaetoceros tenuissimus]|uniref:Uncharacterized protein n=1 Tax=Chaetoceros tenuissimus TaxID=426638 RepID=A0AAD3D2T3_9STRA|nr:predicted protein [Chaetoceros tenuissimus]
MRGEKADRDALLFLMPIVAGSFLLIISNFTRLTIHVYKAEELMRLEQAQQRNAPENVEKYSFCKEVMKYFCQCCMCRKHSEEEEEDPPKRSLAFESFIQSSLWVAIYMLIYIPPVVVFAANARGKSPPKPKIQKTRRVYPQLKDAPYWVVFVIVLFSGGECPKEIDFGSSYTNHSSSPPEPTPEEEEADAEKKRISQMTPSENEQALRDMIGDEDIFSNDFWLKHFGHCSKFRQ